MFKSKFSVVATTFMLASLLVSVDHTRLALAGECESVRGHITSQILPTGCTSPVGLCTVGRFRGDIKGDFVFTASSLKPAANPDFAQTSVAFYTGDLVLHTEKGDVVSKDAGAFNVVPNSNGDFGSVQTIIAGTGDLEGITGRLRTEGVFINGCIDCRYRGEICTP